MQSLCKTIIMSLFCFLFGISVILGVESGDTLVAPVFLYGGGAAAYHFLEGDRFHDLPRDEALAVIRDELRKAGFDSLNGPWLVDQVTTPDEPAALEMMEYASVCFYKEDLDNLPDFVHPFYFDLFVPCLNVGIKYINCWDSPESAGGRLRGIDYFRVELIGPIQLLSEQIRGKSPVHAVFFYDPLSRCRKGDWKSQSFSQLRQQVQEFLRWARHKHLTDNLSSQDHTSSWPVVSDQRIAAMRAVVADPSADAATLLLAVEWLGAARDASSIEPLISRLGHCWSRIGEATLRSLEQIGSPAAVPSLIHRLPKHDQFRKIVATLDTLDPHWPERPATRAILPLLESQERGGPNDIEMKVCLRIDRDWTVAAYIDDFRRGKLDSWSHEAFLPALGPEHLPAVLDYLRTDSARWSDWPLLQRALQRMDPSWRDHTAYHELIRERIQLLATHGCKNSDSIKQLDNLFFLNKVDLAWRQWPGASDKIISLVAHLRDSIEENPHLLNDAVWPLILLGHPAADQLLAEWCHTYVNESSFIEAFTRACYDMSYQPAIPWLMEGLTAEEPMSRAAIYSVLGVMGGPEVHDGLLRGLNDPDHYARRAAVRAVGKRKLVAAVPQLEKMMISEREDMALALAVAESLACIGRPGSAGPVAQAMKTWRHDPAASSGLVEHLAAWESPEVAAALDLYLAAAIRQIAWNEGLHNDQRWPYLNLALPEMGVEGAIRWIVRTKRTDLAHRIRPFLHCPSPRHRALADSALHRLRLEKEKGGPGDGWYPAALHLIHRKDGTSCAAGRCMPAPPPADYSRSRLSVRPRSRFLGLSTVTGVLTDSPACSSTSTYSPGSTKGRRPAGSSPRFAGSTM